MSRRSTVRRRIKKRGVMPSFGDIVLPVVSVAAVILLILAARQFFLNGLKTSPGISSTRAFAESPALIAEREKNNQKSELESLLPSVSNDAAEEKLSENVLTKSEDEFIAMAVATQAPAPHVSVTEKIRPSQTAAKAPAKPSTASKKTSAPKTATSTTSTSISKQWRVQIGAYTSKTGAQEAAKKVKEAGYNAIIYQNPASKHVKVWVQGGATKASAERVVEAMKKIGYKGSFVFPPAK